MESFPTSGFRPLPTRPDRPVHSPHFPRSWTRRRFLGALGLGTAGAVASCARTTVDAPVSLWLIWPADPGMPVTRMLDRFTALHPGVRLEVNPIWTSNLKDKLQAAARSRALPDVFMLNSAWVDDLGGRDSLVDLAPFAATDGLDPAQLLVPHDYARCRSRDGLLCLPAVSAAGTAMLFTNRPLLDQLGVAAPERITGWEHLCAVSRETVRRANRGAVLDYAALDPFSGPGLVLHTALAFGSGSPTVSEDGRRSRLDSPGSLRAARALDRYVEEVYAPFGGYRGLLHFRFRFSGQHRQPSYYSLPYARMLCFVAAAGTVSAVQKFGMKLGEHDVQPVPGLDRPHGGVRAHWWAYGINRRSPRQADAWRAVRFFSLEAEGGGRFCLDYTRPAHLQSVGDADYRRAIGPAWTGVKEACELDTDYPAAPGDDFLRPLVYGVPMRRLQGESIEEIFRDLHARYQAYLDRSVPVAP